MVQLRGGLLHRYLLTLLVVLGAQHVGANPWEARGLDMAGDNGYAASWLGSMADAQGDSMGYQGAKYKDEIGESSQWSSEALRGILTDLDEAAQELNHETVEALQEGKRRGATASGGEMGAYSSVDEPGVDDKKNAKAADQFQKPCAEGIVAILGSMLLGMVFCCVIHLWRKRRRRIAAASASQAAVNGRTTAVESRIPPSNPSEHRTPQPSRVPAKAPRQPPSRPPRPPPPQLPWLSNSASRVLQEQHSSLDYPEREEPPRRPPSRPPRPPPPQFRWLSNSASRVLQEQHSSLDYPEREEPPRRPPSRPPRPPPPQFPWLSNSASRVLQEQHSSLDYPEREEPPRRPPKPVPRSRF